MKKLIAMILCLAMVCTLFAACNNQNPADNPSTPGNSTPGNSDNPPATENADFSETGTLNLVWNTEGGTETLPMPWGERKFATAMLYDPLVAVDPNDGVTIVPKIASDWDVSADGLTYTFTIRDDVVWHDGTPLTPKDVVFTINNYLKIPTVNYPGIFNIIEGADAVAAGEAESCSGIEVDGNVITLHLTAAKNTLLPYFAILSILPEHILGDKDPLQLGQWEDFMKNPVGCGPYKVESVNLPNYFTLVRNDDYYGEPAGVRRVNLISYAVGGDDAISAAMVSGELDFVYNANEITRAENMLANNANLDMNIIPATYARYFVFNTAGATDGKYNDDMLKTKVRQAFNLLLDKQGIADFYVGQASPLTSYINPDSSSYNTDIPLFERDVETAKKLLAEADFNFDRTVRIAYYYNDPTTADIMSLIVQNFAEAGVKAETVFVTGDIVDILYNQHNWDICYFGNYGFDPVEAFYYNIVTPTDALFQNIQGDHDAEIKAAFTKLYSDYFAATTDAEKAALLDEFQIKHLESMYTIPVYALNKVSVINTAKFSYPDGLFSSDIIDWQDYKFETWELLSE